MQQGFIQHSQWFCAADNLMLLNLGALQKLKLCPKCDLFTLLTKLALTFVYYSYTAGVRGSVVTRHYATNRKVTGTIPDEVNF
jgi:hypothetical protein